MDIKIAFHHLDKTDAIVDYVEKRLSSLEKFNIDITHIDVILSVVKSEQKAEANLHGSTHPINAQAISSDLYFSIDELERKLTEQLKKLHDKQTEHHTKYANKKML